MRSAQYAIARLSVRPSVTRSKSVEVRIMQFLPHISPISLSLF